MKAQFKYSFRAGLQPRLLVFAIILVMNLVFIVLDLLGSLPFAAHITAVSLSGTAIAVMSGFNIAGDVAIARRMFSAPGAVLYALTPVPRWKTLLSSVVSILVMNFVTLAFSIAGVVFLSLGLGSRYTGVGAWEMLRQGSSFVQPQYSLIYLAIFVAAYLMLLMTILFCVAMRKSAFFNKPAGGFLAVLLAVGVFYVFTLSGVLLAPFGTVSRFRFFFTVTVGYTGMGMYALLMFIIAAALFALTSILVERKINI